MIPTWNDWAEETVIEPTLESGTKYLEMTRDYAARFKHETGPRTAILLVPIWIYKIRETTSDPAALRDMASASPLIAAGRYAEAERLIKPWAPAANGRPDRALDPATASGRH